MNLHMGNVREIKDKILLKSVKKDKNNKDYLLLDLEDSREKILVFQNWNTSKQEWEKLKEGEEYVFTVKDGNFENSNILVEFEKISTFSINI